MECEFCKHTFSSKTNLNNHVKTATYCLRLQGVNQLSDEHKCDGCSKIFGRKYELNRHSKTCKKNNILQNNEKTIKSLTDENLVLKKELELLRSDKTDLQERYDNLSLTALNKNFEDGNDNEEIVYDSESDMDMEEYKLQPLELNNGYTIEHREEDGFVNVTNLCKAAKKQFSDWNELDETDEFLEVLSSSIGLPPNELIKYKTSSSNEKEIWTHPQVAINIAQWISPSFDVKVSSWVFEAMMTGKVYVTNTKSYKELQKENKKKDLKIQFLTKKYVKLQPRVQYDEKYVIYILTTKLMKKERRYILGKAVDLKCRLSTYNKSDEHEVIFFASCKDVETMNLVENLVFSHLKNYREQANRERFVLPQNEKIELFSNAIKKSIEFLK